MTENEHGPKTPATRPITVDRLSLSIPFAGLRAVLRRRLPITAAFLVVVGLQTTLRPESVGTGLGDVLKRPLPIREGIGRAHESVTTSSSRAQAYYDQGLAYLHLYVWIEAARSFNEALRIDPDLAMAHLGLSYALAELNQADAARKAAAVARSLSARTTEREQFRIDVRVTQLDAAAAPDSPASRAPYLSQLEQMLARFPDDVEMLHTTCMRMCFAGWDE